MGSRTRYIILVLAANAWACDAPASYGDATDTLPEITVDIEDSASDTDDDGPADTVDLPADPGGDSTGTLSCSAVVDCLEACAADDTACVTDCVSQVCDPSKTAMYALLSCKGTHCSIQCEEMEAETCITCMEIQCGDEVTACEAAGC